MDAWPWLRARTTAASSRSSKRLHGGEQRAEWNQQEAQSANGRGGGGAGSGSDVRRGVYDTVLAFGRPLFLRAAGESWQRRVLLAVGAEAHYRRQRRVRRRSADLDPQCEPRSGRAARRNRHRRGGDSADVQCRLFPPRRRRAGAGYRSAVVDRRRCGGAGPRFPPFSAPRVTMLQRVRTEEIRDGGRVVRAPRGTALTAKSWLTEAPLRMLMNNLDPEVAENPAELVVYGGIGRAARNWACFDAIVKALTDLDDDESLLVQ